MNGAPSLDPDTRVEWHPDHLAAEIDGQVVVMSLSQGKYVGLNDPATLVWRRLQRPQSVAALVDGLIRDFAGDAATIRCDTVDLLVRLHELGLIRIAGGAA